jgi:hypothetical protein
MYTVTFVWPSFDAEEGSYKKFQFISDAVQYGYEKMRTMPAAVACIIVRPGRPSVRIWWETHHLVDNLDDLEREEPSLAQKGDWRKNGF